MSILSQQIRSPNINICVYSDLTTGLLSSNPARYQGGLVNTAPSSHFYPHDAVIAYFYCPNTVIAWKITVEFNPRTIFFHPLTKMTYHHHCPQSLLLLLATICIAELHSCANNSAKAGSPLNNACVYTLLMEVFPVWAQAAAFRGHQINVAAADTNLSPHYTKHSHHRHNNSQHPASTQVME